MEKIDLIFDTDAGSDCDDIMAMAYLLYAKRNLNINIKAARFTGSAPLNLFTENVFYLFQHLPDRQLVGAAGLTDTAVNTVGGFLGKRPITGL